MVSLMVILDRPLYVFLLGVAVLLWGYLAPPPSDPRPLPPAYGPLTSSYSFASVHSPMIPTLNTREDFTLLVESEGMRRGVEIGSGFADGFTRRFLKNWPSCDVFAMVYAPLVDGEEAAAYDFKPLTTFSPWKDKLQICRNASSACASQYPDHYFDVAFIDGRHEYAGMMEDLNAWWPKVKPGGLFAGHDYSTTQELKEMWVSELPKPILNADGSVRNDGSVVAAVIDFFMLNRNDHYRQVVVTKEEAEFHTWMVRK